jgi:hypothetical protein
MLGLLGFFPLRLSPMWNVEFHYVIIEHGYRIIHGNVTSVILLSAGLGKKLKNQHWEQMTLEQMRKTLQKRSVRLAPNDHFVWQHPTPICDKLAITHLLIKSHGYSAGLKQMENIAGRRRRENALPLNHIMLGAVASCNVILGHYEYLARKYRISNFH